MKKIVLSLFLFTSLSAVTNCYVYDGVGDSVAYPSYKNQHLFTVYNWDTHALIMKGSDTMGAGSASTFGIKTGTSTVNNKTVATYYLYYLSNGNNYPYPKPMCDFQADGIYYGSDNRPLSFSQFLNEMFSDPKTLVGGALLIGGVALTAGGILAPAAIAGLGLSEAAAISVGVHASLAGLGTAAYGISSHLGSATNTYIPPSDQVTIPSGAIKISLDNYTPSKQLVKTDTSGKVKSVTTIPLTMFDKLQSSNVNRSTKSLTNPITQAELNSIKTTTYDYSNNTATTTDATGSSKTTPITTTVNKTTGTTDIISSDSATAPTVVNGSASNGVSAPAGSSTSGSSIYVPQSSGGGSVSLDGPQFNTSGVGSFDNSVATSPAAGTGTGDGLTAGSFGDTGTFSNVDSSSLSSVATNATSFYSNVASNIGSIQNGFSNAVGVVGSGFSSSSMANLSSTSQCNLGFTVLGHYVALDMSIFSNFYPVLFFIGFIAFNYLAIRIFLAGLALGV